MQEVSNSSLTLILRVHCFIAEIPKKLGFAAMPLKFEENVIFMNIFPQLHSSLRVGVGFFLSSGFEVFFGQKARSIGYFKILDQKLPCYTCTEILKGKADSN